MKLGIKACVYCNASYTVATDDDRATFQIDHSYPKSKYPFLCTSFFNLQPSCMHCNQIKSKMMIILIRCTPTTIKNSILFIFN